MRFILVALCLLSLDASADALFTLEHLQPIQRADGSQGWRFAMRWPPANPDAESALNELVGQQLGTARWCPNGWTITSRKNEPKGFLLVEGICKT